jgi:hypothetical protein
VPLWEGFDEWAHYAVVQNLATRGHLLAGRSDYISGEVGTSLELAPGHRDGAQGGVTHDVYWQMPDADRSVWEQKLRALAAQSSKEPDRAGTLAYEAQQAPLYYWLLVPAYQVTARLPLLTGIWLLRFYSLLLASAVIPLGFAFARKIVGDDAHALGITALITATPQLMMTVSHISNDSLAVTAGSLFLFAMFRWKEQPRSMPRAMVLGTVCGLALLTKAYFLALVPPLVAFVAIWAKRHHVYRQAIVLLLLIVGISSWWYARNWLLTHSLSGEQIEVAGNAARLSLFDAALKMNWLKVADFAFLSHIWLGNWSFLVVRSWMYRYFACVAGFAGIGLFWRLVIQHKPGLPANSDLLLLMALYSSFLAALGYHAVRRFQVMGLTGTFGHYLFPIVVVEAVLVTAGLEAIAPAALRHAVIPVGVICLAALEFFGTHFYAIPYYTGLITHLPNGSLPAFNINASEGNSLHTMLARLTINKPELLTTNVMAALWIIFLAVTFALIILTVRLSGVARRKISSPGDAIWLT